MIFCPFRWGQKTQPTETLLVFFLTVTNWLLWITPPSEIFWLLRTGDKWISYIPLTEIRHISVTIDFAHWATDPWLWNLITRKNGMRIFWPVCCLAAMSSAWTDSETVCQCHQAGSTSTIYLRYTMNVICIVEFGMGFSLAELLYN